MATRWYLSSTAQTKMSATVDSSWTGSYASFNRYYLIETTKDSSAFSTLTNTQSFATGSTYTYGQWWSHPITNADTFTATDWNNSTWTVVQRHSESSTTADYVYKYLLRIWDNGSFVQSSYYTGATEFDVGNGATTNSIMESRRINLGDYWGAIGPYNNGIRLVLEMGVGRLTGTAASFSHYTEIGANGAADLDNSEVDVGQDNPWIECSLNFTFSGETANTSKLMLQGVG